MNIYRARLCSLTATLCFVIAPSTASANSCVPYSGTDCSAFLDIGLGTPLINYAARKDPSNLGVVEVFDVGNAGSVYGNIGRPNLDTFVAGPPAGQQSIFSGLQLRYYWYVHGAPNTFVPTIIHGKFDITSGGNFTNVPNGSAAISYSVAAIIAGPQTSGSDYPTDGISARFQLYNYQYPDPYYDYSYGDGNYAGYGLAYNSYGKISSNLMNCSNVYTSATPGCGANIGGTGTNSTPTFNGIFELGYSTTVDGSGSRLMQIDLRSVSQINSYGASGNGHARSFIDPYIEIAPAYLALYPYARIEVLEGFANDPFPDAIPGIPEPSSWALMIGGFGLIGQAMRRRRTFRQIQGAKF